MGEVKRRFPQAPQPWIDLSTGINPVSYPLPDLPPELWTRLPSRAQLDALIGAAASAYGVRDPAMLVAAPGTQALIQLLPRLVPRSRVAIVGPTYEEHELSWRRQGHDVTVVSDLAAAAADADVVVLVNPDNPTGRLVATADLRAIDIKRLLVVDEAFVDFLPRASLAAALPARSVVLRSFGKVSGLAGIRLGYAIAEAGLAERLRDELGPWAVPGPALAIGARALADTKWLEAASARLERDGRHLEALLVKAGFTLLGGTPLFRLARHERAPAAAETLARHGIHVRVFASNPSWLRLGLPGSEAEFERLAAALAQFRS